MCIKQILSTICAAVLFLSSTSFPVEAVETSALLDITAFQILDENIVHLGASYLRDCSVLFDDQDKVPTTPENLSVEQSVWEETSKSNWQPNMQAEFGNASLYIDLRANYVITDICFLDTNGTPTWTISNGEPFDWNEIAMVTMDYYNAWRSISFDDPQPTRYLHIASDYTDTGVSEIALYGYKMSNLSEEQILKTAPKSSDMEQMNLTAGTAIGFNAFIDDPITAIMAGGNVREYHNFSWLIDEDEKIKFTQGTWGNMDAFYTALKNQNISIIPCFQGGSAVIHSDGDSVPEIPVAEGADTLDPNSYAVHAQAFYQVAARYGNNRNIDESTINIADGQEIKTGLNLLSALENSNEPNKSWSGKANYFTPYELAAMCSADYDGHEGTIPNAGVKTADPNFKLAMGGLVGTASMLTYLTEMKTWFDYNRTDGKFAVDIINVHIGPDTCNPEDSNFGERINKLQEWIDQNAPGTELWISEYEVNMTDSVQEGLDNHDNPNYQLKYAQRVARTYLIALSEGVDRITKFQLRDEGEGVYYDSGLVTQKGTWDKKLAWYFVSCMTSVLEYADFVRDVSTENVNIYEFLDRNTGETIKCIWSPTNTGQAISDYHVSVEGCHYAYLTVPSEYAEGTVSSLPVVDDSVCIDVTETPIFLTVSDTEKKIINGRSNRIQAESICLTADGSTEVCKLDAAPEDATLNQFYRMFDEQQTMPEVLYGNTSGLENPQTNVNASNITCYVQFDQSYYFNGFAIFDTYGTGNISVYDARTDTLLYSNDLGSYMNKTIEMTADSAPTDCLKIVKQGGDLNEFAFYGYPATASVDTSSFDYNQDQRINIIDLIWVKRQLLNGSQTVALTDCVVLQKVLLREK